MQIKASWRHRWQMAVTWLCLAIYLLAGSGLAPAVVYGLASLDSEHAVRLVESGSNREVVLRHEKPLFRGMGTVAHHHCPLAKVLTAFSSASAPRPHPDHVLQFSSGAEWFRSALSYMGGSNLWEWHPAIPWSSLVTAAGRARAGAEVKGRPPPNLQCLRSVILLI